MTKEELLKQLGFNEYKKQQFSCEACRIEYDDEQVKQKPAHTCGIDGPIPDISELKADIYKQQPTEPNAAYNAKVQEIAEELAKIDWKVHDKTYDKGRPWETLLPIQQEGLIRSQDASARAMVAKMAKEYEEGFFASLDDSLGLMNEEHPSYVYYNELCVEKMQERGLIPNTKTDNDAV